MKNHAGENFDENKNKFSQILTNILVIRVVRIQVDSRKQKHVK